MRQSLAALKTERKLNFNAAALASQIDASKIFSMTKAPKKQKAIPIQKQREPRQRTKPSWEGFKLRQWREFLNFTVEGLAEVADVSAGLISQIENGDSDGSAYTIQHKLLKGLQTKYPELTLGMLFDVEPTEGGRYIGIWVPEDRVNEVLSVATKPRERPPELVDISPKKKRKR